MGRITIFMAKKSSVPCIPFTEMGKFLFLFSLDDAGLLVSDVCHAHNVGKDASGGDGSARAVALDEHGVFVVALSGE